VNLIQNLKKKKVRWLQEKGEKNEFYLPYLQGLVTLLAVGLFTAIPSMFDAWI
jgi:hypothetical protein